MRILGVVQPVYRFIFRIQLLGMPTFIIIETTGSIQKCLF